MKQTLFLTALLASSVAFGGWDTNSYYAGESEAADAIVSTVKSTGTSAADVMVYSYENKANATAHIGTLTVADTTKTITIGTPTANWGKGRTGFAVTIDTLEVTSSTQLTSVSAETDKDDSVSVGALRLNGAFTGKTWLTNLYGASTLDFGTTGSLNLGQEVRNHDYKGLQLVFTASVTLSADGAGSRQLVSADNAWWLAGAGNSGNEDSIFDYSASTLTATDATPLVKCDFVSDKKAAWTLEGQAVDFATSGPVYRFVANGDGVYVQYTPEPATATLSLLALAGLCARRKRH